MKFDQIFMGVPRFSETRIPEALPPFFLPLCCINKYIGPPPEFKILAKNRYPINEFHIFEAGKMHIF